MIIFNKYKGFRYAKYFRNKTPFQRRKAQDDGSPSGNRSNDH
jgi:hypothetical protein